MEDFLHNFQRFIKVHVCLPINTTTWLFVFTKDQRTNVNPAVMADVQRGHLTEREDNSLCKKMT